MKKIVAPKQKRLAEAQEQLKDVEAKLAEKEAAKKQQEDLVAELQKDLDKSIRQTQIYKA